MENAAQQQQENNGKRGFVYPFPTKSDGKEVSISSWLRNDSLFSSDALSHITKSKRKKN